MKDKDKLTMCDSLLDDAIVKMRNAQKHYLSISTNTTNSDVRDVNELIKDIVDSIDILKKYMGIK